MASLFGYNVVDRVTLGHLEGSGHGPTVTSGSDVTCGQRGLGSGNCGHFTQGQITCGHECGFSVGHGNAVGIVMVTLYGITRVSRKSRKFNMACF